MGGSMKLRGEGTALNGFIDKGSHVRGDLAFEESFRIDGRFEGKIRSGSELILGDDADVTAEIDVGRLSVNGSLKGPCARPSVWISSQRRASSETSRHQFSAWKRERFFRAGVRWGTRRNPT